MPEAAPLAEAARALLSKLHYDPTQSPDSGTLIKGFDTHGRFRLAQPSTESKAADQEILLTCSSFRTPTTWSTKVSILGSWLTMMTCLAPT